MKTKIQLFAERLTKAIEMYRNLNEGERLDAVTLADDLCDDLERPINLVSSLESLVRNAVWMRAKEETRSKQGI